MPLRIRSAPSQVAFLIVAYVLILLCGIVVSVLATVSLGSLLAGLLTVGAVVVAGRTFRAPEEDSEPPRPWWRLTYSPRTAFVWSALFAIGGVGNVVAGPGGLATGGISVLIAAAFLGSALRTIKEP